MRVCDDDSLLVTVEDAEGLRLKVIDDDWVGVEDVEEVWDDDEVWDAEVVPVTVLDWEEV